MICLHCGRQMPQPQTQNAFEGYRTICTDCTIKKIRSVQEAESKKRQEIEKEEHRALVVADRYREQILRQHLQAKRDKEYEDTIEEGGAIPCL
jgi:hypothetical protein